MVSIVLYLSETYSNCSKIGNSIKTALDIIRHKLPDFYTSHLQDDDFKITKEEFIDRHIDELIMLESTGRRSRRDNYVFDFREMNSYIDYEAAPVASKVSGFLNILRENEKYFKNFFAVTV